MRLRALLALLLVLLPAPAIARDAARAAAEPVWAFEQSDLPVETEYRFGQLDNGLRFVIRRNGNPQGTALVRMEVAAGSLDERDDERGFAHFVEHMAFNGSTNVPEGEMVRLLERAGLAFGADTNAATGFETTTYKLDLPRADPWLLATALMLMRETASELQFLPGAVERERGVMLAELRDRNTWSRRNAMAQARFLHPHALYPERFPVGTAEALEGASADALRAFWRREYVPARTTVIVIGDFDAGDVERAIRERFAGWLPGPIDPTPSAGPVDARDAGRTAIHTDQALSERITASRHAAWLDEPDTIAQRQENLLRQIGYAIVNRRLSRIARQGDPPFRDAGFGTGNVFRAGRTTNLVVDTIDGKWRPGLVAAAIEVRRALNYGFADAEVAEQVAAIRNAARNAAASAGTRGNAALAASVFALLRDGVVPSPPASVLERLETFIPRITPESVLAALKREAVPLKRPLLRFQGRRQPAGGEKEIRRAWKQAMRAPLEKSAHTAAAAFAYSDFGPPGTVVSDSREGRLGIREIVFANGARLNIRRTDIERDAAWVKLSIDGGDMLATRNNPLATQMAAMLPSGGLGRHSEDELQSILAGRTVGTQFRSGADSFVASARTTPADLELQLRLYAAFLSDPGYRPEAEVKYRLNINNFFARLRATPASALAAEIGGILSDRDPRFTLQQVEDYRRLTFARLKQDIGGQLASGAVELGVVGDVNEDEVIAAFAATLGALPPRESTFRAWPEGRMRGFTEERGLRVIRHRGPADQALLHMVWPTRDDSDPVEALKLELLERIVRLRLTETLREQLGEAYSPAASSDPSRHWTGYGTFTVSAQVNAAVIDAARQAITATIAALRSAPVSADLLRRARQPMLEAHANALKSNAGWLSLVDRAQTEPERIDRYLLARERLQAITAEEVMETARAYLDPRVSVEIDVLPAAAGPAGGQEPAANASRAGISSS